MAQRYGGQYSPGGASQDGIKGGIQAPPPPSLPREGGKAGFRSWLLFVLPFLFAIGAFSGEPAELIAGLATFALLMASAWLTRDGILAQQAYDARNIARRPAIPRKIFGSVLTGAGLGLHTALSGEGIAIAVAFGLTGAALHLAAFGADPMADKGAEGIDQFQSDRVARAVDEAEKHLAAMKDAILRANDRRIAQRVDRFADTARGLFRTIETDPGDLTGARKYLSVYLQGARDATVKFADHFARTGDVAAKIEYETLLNDLETTFADRTKSLLAGGKSDLDVEISVLRDRLKFEK
jgi:5-bromo-4-chloroindolyl phosphate hydrolysis protein